MRQSLWALALSACAQAAHSVELLMNEPTILYNDVSPKLRVITKQAAFAGTEANNDQPNPIRKENIGSKRFKITR
jgi:hypothetical protein